LWSKRWGGVLTLEEKAFGVATDAAGNIVLTGSIADTFDFGGGPIPGDGYYDIFLAKFASTGAHLWSKRTGGGEGIDVTFDAVGNVIAAGNFTGSTTVNFGGANLLSPGGTDTFLVKLGP
ncbi:MAG: nucleotide-binding protein, partial [Acidobacteriota bacterium]|nr:nucleotide-binding protein [Acidobacteriota bacterium]